MAEYRRLDELCELNMGQSPDSSSYNENAEGLPFFQGNADFGEIHPTVRIWCNAPTKIVEPGTLLISVRAPIGALNFASERSCIGRGLAGISAKNGVELKYIYYCLKGKHSELNAKGTGSTFKAISKSALGETAVKIIPQAEQIEVIQVLDRVSDIIAARKKQIAELDNLVKARFVEMFGDPIRNNRNYRQIPLEQLCDVGSSKRIFEKEYVDKGIPFYRTKEVVELSKGNEISTELFITKERFEEIRNKYGVPQKNDLLISAVGTIGVIWIVDGESDFYFKDGNLLRIASSSKFDSVYMKYLLESLIANYKQQMSVGTAYAALTIAGLKQMQVYDVPLSLQQEFATFVAQVDKSKVVVHKALNETQMLFDSLMQEYFG